MKILIVEDEAEMLSALKRGFIKKGYTVDTACDGITASYLAETNVYDVIVLDSVNLRMILQDMLHFFNIMTLINVKCITKRIKDHVWNRTALNHLGVKSSWNPMQTHKIIKDACTIFCSREKFEFEVFHV